MSKLVIFDKDGTLVAPAAGGEWVQHPEDQILLPGVAEGIAALRRDGWHIAIASNQGGVAAGHKSLGSAIDEMFFAMRLAGIELGMAAHSYENEYGEAIFLDLQDGGMQWRPITNRQRKFRKPHDGMINFLASRFCGTRFFDKKSVLFIGDRPEDQGAALMACVRFVWAEDWRRMQKQNPQP